MEKTTSRHRCLIYEGPPARQLPALASAARKKLQENYRCLYLNSPSVVAAMQTHLEAVHVDVARETARASLVLSSAQHHLVDGGIFDIDRMIGTLRTAVDQALHDGYRGLWASGDMIWEFGPARDFSKLLEYEWRLEEFFHECPELVGVCQYRADMLPRSAVRHGLRSHRSIFVNDARSMINPRYIRPESFSQEAGENLELDHFINHLVQQQPSVN
jgi:hypothetical protein